MLEQSIEKLTIECEPATAAFLNEHAIADLLVVSVATLRRWRLLRKGPPLKKLGRLVRYSRVDTLQWLDTKPSHRDCNR